MFLAWSNRTSGGSTEPQEALWSAYSYSPTPCGGLDLLLPAGRYHCISPQLPWGLNSTQQGQNGSPGERIDSLQAGSRRIQ
ncbi:hypothetical protein NDU88_002766 [Pleurodeles waltl]|uniref:Uncharacterized protein n=1 Tax=Pleurodeles waltl TaxID=8319 RepID=A0AAV7WQG5_PLEWA|nr:hypothetical protein NDU88_002766 [Pleurodeles waltl]